MEENVFSQIDFGPLKEYLENDDVTDVSYSQSQVHLKTLSQGVYRVENPEINNAFMEKLAFQCANAMGKTFNMAHPMLDSESAELRMNFIHDSISRNGISCVIRKTPAKIRLEKTKLLNENYVTEDIHDFLITCVQGHCNIIVCGETGSGKTEFVKYLASKTKENEKIITIEDTLELHLDRIFPHRDIVTLKTNNIASYSDVLVACMRQNPIWILLSEVRSAEAVTAVRNSISSGHFILSTIHADKSASIPMRMYSLMETSQDVEQFLTTVYRYIQLGVCIRGRQDKVTKKFVREIADISEFYVDENNIPRSHLLYKKTSDGRITRDNPTKYLIDYLDTQGIELPPINAGEYDPAKDEAPEMPKGTSLKGAAMPKADEKETVENKEEAKSTEIAATHETTNAPEVAVVPELPKAPEVKAVEEPKVPEAPKAPEVAVAPELPKVPEVKAVEEPKVPEAPKAPEVAVAPELPKVPEVKAVEEPKAPEAPVAEPQKTTEFDFSKYMPVMPAKPAPAPVAEAPVAPATPAPSAPQATNTFFVPKYAPVMPNTQPATPIQNNVAAPVTPATPVAPVTPASAPTATFTPVAPAPVPVTPVTPAAPVTPASGPVPTQPTPVAQSVAQPLPNLNAVVTPAAAQPAQPAQPTPAAQPEPAPEVAPGLNELNQMIAEDLNG